MREDANALSYAQMKLLGHPILFNDMRIRPETIPDGLLLFGWGSAMRGKPPHLCRFLRQHPDQPPDSARFRWIPGNQDEGF